MKLKINKETLQELYEDELNNVLEQCDWITYVDSHMVCEIVSSVLKRTGEEIETEKLHELYMSEIKSLKLKEGEWGLNFKIKEIISMIYDIIQTKYQ